MVTWFMPDVSFERRGSNEHTGVIEEVRALFDPGMFAVLLCHSYSYFIPLLDDLSPSFRFLFHYLSLLLLMT